MFITQKAKTLPLVCLMLCLVALYANTAIAQTASGTQATLTTSTTSVTTAPPEPSVTSSALTPAQQKRVTNLSANVSNKLDATTVRLTNIVLRMESRMRIMEQEGKDVSAARTQLDAAKNALESIRATLRTIDTDVAKVTSSENPQKEWLRVRKIFVDTGMRLEQVKQTLQESLNAMKTAAPLVTTTEQSTTTPAQ